MARTFVIGDIHGNLVALNALLHAIALTPSDTLITLGDYIDRGPDSKGVLDRMIQLQSQCLLIPLLGNHEEMMLMAHVLGAAHGRLYEWLMNGGDKTLASYVQTPRGGPTPRFDPTAVLAQVPAAHWQFLSAACRSFHETATHLFVHANANPALPLAEQTTHTLRWERFYDPPQHVSGKILVCGHTPQKSGFPRFIGHAVCLDTGIHAGRMLTCLEIETGTITQSDPQGNVRRSRLEDHRVIPG
jgi:serine/threonine protein phosphatase 1